MQTLGQRIKAIRLAQGETMTEFSSHFENAMSGTVSNWETDRNKPNKARLKKIAELGNMTVEELLNGSNPLSLFSDTDLINELKRREVLRNANNRPKD